MGALKAELKVPMGLDTDVNGSCLGEVTYGCAKGLDSVIYITIGTGVGVGVCVNGSCLHGMLHPEGGHVFLPRHPGPGRAVSVLITKLSGGLCQRSLYRGQMGQKGSGTGGQARGMGDWKATTLPRHWWTISWLLSPSENYSGRRSHAPGTAVPYDPAKRAERC